ncbi:class I SAM-dependent methyltransferase [Candidatus Woesearchaeota archaeon]|nr:class I SAM-dependent methyltransferase [Candidatus Woesearchaeota archaeon]
MPYIPEEYWNNRYKTFKNVGHSDVDYYRYEESIRYAIFKRLIHLKAGIKMLDVGCGDGVWAVKNAKRKAEVTAVDISEECILAAEQRNKENNTTAQFKVSKAEDINFPNEQFDIVYSITVLQHIPTQEKLEQAVFKMITTAKKNGNICILEKAPLEDSKSDVDHITIRTKKEWIDLFNKHGAVFITEKAMPQIGYCLLKWYDSMIAFLLKKFAKNTLEESKQEKKEYLATNEEKSLKIRIYNIGKEMILFFSYPIDHLLIYIPIYNKSVTRFLLFRRR